MRNMIQYLAVSAEKYTIPKHCLLQQKTLNNEKNTTNIDTRKKISQYKTKNISVQSKNFESLEKTK